MSEDVMNSPALALLVRLEDAGVQVSAIGEQLRVKPIARLTDQQRAELQAHRADVLMLLRVCDPGVQDRREAFRAQLADGDAIPSFRYSAMTWVLGTCYSCGDAVEGLSRCWRCGLALRLAVRAAIPANFMDAYTRLKVA